MDGNNVQMREVGSIWLQFCRIKYFLKTIFKNNL